MSHPVLVYNTYVLVNWDFFRSTVLDTLRKSVIYIENRKKLHFHLDKPVS